MNSPVPHGNRSVFKSLEADYRLLQIHSYQWRCLGLDRFDLRGLADIPIGSVCNAVGAPVYAPKEDSIITALPIDDHASQQLLQTVRGSPVTVPDIQRETSADPTLQKAIQFLRTRWRTKSIDNDLQLLFHRRRLLHVWRTCGDTTLAGLLNRREWYHHRFSKHAMVADGRHGIPTIEKRLEIVVNGFRPQTCPLFVLISSISLLLPMKQFVDRIIIKAPLVHSDRCSLAFTPPADGPQTFIRNFYSRHPTGVFSPTNVNYDQLQSRKIKLVHL
ncbi:hypothetical protein CLF_103410 [Clonorchis sinensis]|uniref:Uncharacterized protein n=1 Tax=Clonorchis sinensis TaxID=79923 RepID=G7YNF8_CLOSI|nr:hypothetical protein CLF_103410 [Clonorchis sinensis]